jgi:hypothetical protein
MAARPCHGQRKDGSACKANALKGKDFCRTHMPAAAVDGVDGLRASGARARDSSQWDREQFLAALEYTGMVSEACAMVGISRQTAYVERQRNEEFAVAWSNVDERVIERLEQEAFRRAHHGVPRLIVSAGKKLGTEQQYSDGLLQFLLKAKRPEKYRERVDVAHSGGVQHDVAVRVDLSKLSDAQLDALDSITETLAA